MAVSGTESRKHPAFAPGAGAMSSVRVSLSSSESFSSPELPATGGEEQPKARQTNKDSTGRIRRMRPVPPIRGSASSGVWPAKTRQESATKAKGRTIEKPLPQKPATGGHASSSGEYTDDYDDDDASSEIAEAKRHDRKREGKDDAKHKKDKDRMAQPAASGASAKHVRGSRSHRLTIDKTHGKNDYERCQKLVSGRKSSKDQKPASGGNGSSSKDQKSASGGKANKHDREKAQKPVSGGRSSKDQKPASGGKESSSKDQKSASAGKANNHDREKAQKPPLRSPVRDEDRSRSPGRTHGKSTGLELVLRPRARSQSPSSATGGRNDSPSPSPSWSPGRRRSAWLATGGPSRGKGRGKIAWPGTAEFAEFHRALQDQVPSRSPSIERWIQNMFARWGPPPPATRTRDHCPSPSPARKRGKIASPAFGGRNHSRSPSPAGGQGAPAIGRQQVQLLPGPMLLKRNIEGFVTNCLDYKSEWVLNKADGLKDASSRNLDKQRSVLEGADRFHALLQEMPLGEPPATGGVEAALKTIKCLLNLHRGELREWHGWWEAVDAPHDKPGMWHDQFFPPHAADPGAISTVLSKPASGGKPGDTGGYSVRVAIVFGLADLFFDHGQAHSAAELYQLYNQLRVFASRRANTRPKSRMAHWHWKRS